MILWSELEGSTIGEAPFNKSDVWCQELRLRDAVVGHHPAAHGGEERR
jgi:hypothetical protein